MARVAADMTITLDGYASGRDQSRENPFGDLGPDRLHPWQFDHENAEERAAASRCRPWPATLTNRRRLTA